MLIGPGMPEAPLASVCWRKCAYLLPVDPVASPKDHLGNPVTAVQAKRILSEVDEPDPDLTSVIGVNGARGVDHSQAVFYCEPAPRANLKLVSRRKCHG